MQTFIKTDDKNPKNSEEIHLMLKLISSTRELERVYQENEELRKNEANIQSKSNKYKEEIKRVNKENEAYINKINLIEATYEETYDEYEKVYDENEKLTASLKDSIAKINKLKVDYKDLISLATQHELAFIQKENAYKELNSFLNLLRETNSRLDLENKSNFEKLNQQENELNEFKKRIETSDNEVNEHKINNIQLNLDLKNLNIEYNILKRDYEQNKTNEITNSNKTGQHLERKKRKLEKSKIKHQEIFTVTNLFAKKVVQFLFIQKNLSLLQL